MMFSTAAYAIPFSLLFSLAKEFKMAPRCWLVERSNGAPGQLGISTAMNRVAEK